MPLCFILSQWTTTVQVVMMNGDLSRPQREVILWSLRSWIRPCHAALQDTESDTPECEPADRLVNDHVGHWTEMPWQGSVGERKGSQGSASRLLCNRQDFWNGVVEDMCVRGGNETAPGCYGYRGWNSALQYKLSGKVTEGTMRPRRDATATGA